MMKIKFSFKKQFFLNRQALYLNWSSSPEPIEKQPIEPPEIDVFDSNCIITVIQLNLQCTHHIKAAKLSYIFL